MLRSYLSLTNDKQRFVLPEPGMLEVWLLLRHVSKRGMKTATVFLTGREVKGEKTLENAERGRPSSVN